MRTVILAARTARSMAYLQALRHADLTPDAVLLFEDPAREVKPSPAPLGDFPPGIFRPDYREPIEETVQGEGWQLCQVACDNVNDPLLYEAARELEPDLLVYAGYGGQIVKEPILGLAPILHAHSGWLPEERGSTTLYYRLLRQNDVAVSALLLAAEIDTGSLLLRRCYPAPLPSSEIDLYYDNMIRADAVVDVLRHVMANGELPPALPQSGTPETYYVIHPVLKHIARLSIENPAAPGGRRIVET